MGIAVGKAFGNKNTKVRKHFVDMKMDEDGVYHVDPKEEREDLKPDEELLLRPHY